MHIEIEAYEKKTRSRGAHCMSLLGVIVIMIIIFIDLRYAMKLMFAFVLLLIFGSVIKMYKEIAPNFDLNTIHMPRSRLLFFSGLVFCAIGLSIIIFFPDLVSIARIANLFALTAWLAADSASGAIGEYDPKYHSKFTLLCDHEKITVPGSGALYYEDCQSISFQGGCLFVRCGAKKKVFHIIGQQSDKIEQLRSVFLQKKSSDGYDFSYSGTVVYITIHSHEYSHDSLERRIDQLEESVAITRVVVSYPEGNTQEWQIHPDQSYWKQIRNRILTGNEKQ